MKISNIVEKISEKDEEYNSASSKMHGGTISMQSSNKNLNLKALEISENNGFLKLEESKVP
jgi:hypothetical protein